MMLPGVVSAVALVSNMEIAVVAMGSRSMGCSTRLSLPLPEASPAFHSKSLFRGVVAGDRSSGRRKEG